MRSIRVSPTPIVETALETVFGPQQQEIEQEIAANPELQAALERSEGGHSRRSGIGTTRRKSRHECRDGRLKPAPQVRRRLKAYSTRKAKSFSGCGGRF